MALKRLLLLSALLALGGCGAGGSVNNDPLTRQLGASATSVQQAETALLTRTISTGLDAGPTREIGQVLELALAGRLNASTVHRIEVILRNPDKPYQAADAMVARLSGLVTEAHNAAIPASATKGSSGPIRSFVADWNRYALVLAGGLEQSVFRFRQASVLKGPTSIFLRQTDRAVKARDRGAYIAARRTFIAALKRLGAAGAFAPVTALSQESAAFARLLADANNSDEVHRLVTAVIHDFPDSLFAKRFNR